MTELIALDGAEGEGGGQILRAALALSCATGQGFRIERIRARRPRPGLRPQHLAAVRACSLACRARVGGAFEGSPDLRFEPGAMEAGEFRFEIGTAGACTLVLQTLLPALARAGQPSRVEVTGGTHVPASPSFDYLSRHWCRAVTRVGLEVEAGLRRAGFYPPGGGELWARVRPWTPPTAALDLESRGALVRVRGVCGTSTGKLEGYAERLRDAAHAELWESRRLEAEWQTLALPSASPGWFVLLEAEYEGGGGAFGFLGERRVRPEVLGARAARRLLRFLDEDGAVDAHLADQLAVPMALSGQGGRVSTVEVTRHLESVAATLRRFGIAAQTWGRSGGPGGLEVGAC